jgi:LPS sulfotransferase NodH
MNRSTASTDRPYDADMIRMLRTRPKRTATRKVLILATPRSGSTYFCDMLTSTGMFGEPAEWLNPRGISNINKRSDVRIRDIASWWGHLQRTAVSDNGVFSIKVMVRQYRYWLSQGFDVLSAGFDRVLYVRRNDFVAQAVSLAKARASDRWTSQQKALPQGSLRLTRHQVLAAMAELASYEDYYEAKLANFVHSTWTYEEFAGQPKVFDEVLRDCGIESNNGATPASRTEVQRTDKDSLWTAQFRDWLVQRITTPATSGL